MRRRIFGNYLTEHATKSTFKRPGKNDGFQIRLSLIRDAHEHARSEFQESDFGFSSRGARVLCASRSRRIAAECKTLGTAAGTAQKRSARPRTGAGCRRQG